MHSTFKHKKRLAFIAFAVILCICVVLFFVAHSKKVAAVERMQSKYCAEISVLLSKVAKSGYSSKDARFALGYLNEDAIPEVFVCFGDHGRDTIQIFTYLPEEQAVKNLGDFSSRGSFLFQEKQSVVVSTYGNQGFFPMVYEKVTPSQREILAVEANYIDIEDQTHYYISYPYSGTQETLFETLSAAETTKELYQQKAALLRGTYTNPKTIEYSQMIPYTEENFKSTFTSLLQK